MVDEALWLHLLRKEFENQGDKKKVADKVGVSRSAVSTALAGKYPAGTERLEKKVLAALGNGTFCPYLHEHITIDACTGYQSQPTTTPNPMARRHRKACTNCEHFNNTKGEDRAA